MKLGFDKVCAARYNLTKWKATAMFNAISLLAFIIVMWPHVVGAVLAWGFFTLFIQPDDWHF